MAAWHAREKRRGERPSSSISWHRCLRGPSESLDPPKISDTRSCRWTVICFLPNVDSKETNGVWGPPGAENPSFNTFDASLTSIYSFADDLGYQGSQELTSEEDPSLPQSKRQKRSKVANVCMRKDKVKEEEDEEEAESATLPRRSLRVRRKLPLYSRACQLGQKKQPSTLGSSHSTPTSKTKSSHWSIAGFLQYLCSCCSWWCLRPGQDDQGDPYEEGPARNQENPNSNPL
ncbi:uncharacterized protein LOC144315843 isoform X1 [Canis aureus]